MHLLFNWWLIDFHIKIGESGFNWHPTSYSCTVIGRCEPTSFKSISLWANEWLIYHSASLRGNKFASFEPTTLWVANLQISNLRGFQSTKVFLNITFERTHQIFSTFCILEFFMKLMSKILVIFMFLPDIYSAVFASLNSIVTLDSIREVQYYSLKSRNWFLYQR